MTTLAPPAAAPLTAADRCQARCGAQAFVAVTIPVTVSHDDLVVLYCAHHFDRHRDAVTAAGGVVVADNRDTINSKPTG